jgi:hypothetical protein
MVALLVMLTGLAAAPASAAPAVGTEDLIAWQGQGPSGSHKSDVAIFIHYNMATAAGTQGCGGCGSVPPPDLELWNPVALDTDGASWLSCPIERH